MEELLDTIYINYDAWSRLSLVGLIGICFHWGFTLDLKHAAFPMAWFLIILTITASVFGCVVLRIIDQNAWESKHRFKLQKYMMFSYGPALFLANWLSFFGMVDQIVSQMPYSMGEWAFLLTVSLYNLYSFLLIHFANISKNKSLLLERIN